VRECTKDFELEVIIRAIDFSMGTPLRLSTVAKKEPKISGDLV
tara:strand:+ start:444 stop:572 length:129 start_codon:yes stop_codon:yes gene_type:complete